MLSTFCIMGKLDCLLHSFHTLHYHCPFLVGGIAERAMQIWLVDTEAFMKIFSFHIQWQIQDFLERDRPLQRWRWRTSLVQRWRWRPILSWKLHENERNWTERGRAFLVPVQHADKPLPPNFPVHVRGGKHKWSTDLCTPTGLCSISFSTCVVWCVLRDSGWRTGMG